MNPDRVVVGVDSQQAHSLMERLYKPFLLNGFPILFMDVSSAEMTKYAANAMLATRISFMNDIANLCERIGANVDMVRKGMGTDDRIGSRFLYAGCGYGGSCFPKDVKALCHTGRKNGYPMRVIEAVEAVNETQKEIVADKLKEALGAELTGKVVALWGLAFKPKPTICAKHRLWSLSTNCSKPGQRFGLSTRSPWTKRAERSATKSLIAITSTKPPKEPTPSHWPRNGSNSGFPTGTPFEKPCAET